MANDLQLIGKNEHKKHSDTFIYPLELKTPDI